MSPWGMCREKRRRCVIRGGNWNNGANAGVFYFNGNNSRANVNWNVGFRSALALFCYCLRATARQKHRGKRDAFPGRQGQRSAPVQPAGESHQRRRANRGGWPFPRKRVKAAEILWCGDHRGTDAPRSVTRGPLF